MTVSALAWYARPLLELKLRGLGPRSKEKLAEGGIVTVKDLIELLPRDYLDYTELRPISQVPLEIPVSIHGEIIGKQKGMTSKKRLPFIEALLDDGTGTLRVVWYNMAFLDKRIHKGQTLTLRGKVRQEYLGNTMTNPRFSEDGEAKGEIEAVYRQIAGLRSDQIAGWIDLLLANLPDEETLPAELCKQHRFPKRGDALAYLHHPPDGEAIETIRNRSAPALRRIVFEELYHFQVRLKEIADSRQSRDHARLDVDNQWLLQFKAVLPFTLTQDQSKVINTLVHQLQSGQRLQALVQGDVGSGKTVVGWALAYIFIKAGFQVALLCPTTVLADQHTQGAEQMLAPLGIRPVLLSRRASAAEIRQRLEAVREGSANLVIGTHKIFQKDVHFQNLGLVMVDEQHRFGVEQRSALLKKARAAHYMTFTATPIPRSLALTLHGDCTVLQIRQKPANRIPIKTILKKAANRDEIIRFTRARIQTGESAFWVFPLIEGDEEQQEKSAIAMATFFRTGPFQDVRVGLVHGRMVKEEVREEMGRFERGETRVLVATTVIEVGVDVPHASVMVVEGAERFGLSQLHQLRGRVGRGDQQAYCFLVVQGDLTASSLKRLRLLESTNDGFRIAEQDLRERGAGDLLGRQQTGFSALTHGDLLRDQELLTLARQAVWGESDNG